MKDRLVVIDVETGGLDPTHHSILTLGAAVVDYAGAILNRFYVPIREAVVSVQAEALGINGLTLQQIEAEGVPVTEAVAMFRGWLVSNDLTKNVTLVGHHVAFDRAFVRRLFRLAKEEALFDETFSHRMICTQSAAGLLDQAGVIRLSGSTSLDSVCAHFGIELDRKNGHHAFSDVVATAQVFQCLMRRCREGL
jgi:DNA polymerase III epsilon subunit-like protein